MGTSRNTDNPGPLDAMQAVISNAMMRIAGIRVGTVVVAYPNGTADVQPVRLREVYGAPQPQPLVSAAPVGWWRFGGMTLVGELEVGDQVLVVNMQRDFSLWWTSGLVAVAPTDRMHDRADVIVLPWLQSLVPSADLHGGPPIRVPGTFRLGRVDGLAGITMWPAKTNLPPFSLTVEIDGGPGGIKLGSSAVEFALKGTTVHAAMTVWIGAVATAGTAWAMTVPPTAVSNGVFIGAVIAATAALALTLPSWLTVKTVLE